MSMFWRTTTRVEPPAVVPPKVDANLVSKRELVRNNETLSQMASAAHTYADRFRSERDVARRVVWAALATGLAVGFVVGAMARARGWL
jgi:hypothetical protein